VRFEAFQGQKEPPLDFVFSPYRMIHNISLVLGCLEEPEVALMNLKEDRRIYIPSFRLICTKTGLARHLVLAAEHCFSFVYAAKSR
jgi:hypothetical protein